MARKNLLVALNTESFSDLQVQNVLYALIFLACDDGSYQQERSINEAAIAWGKETLELRQYGQ